MSLNRLSTELDANIVDYCDRAALLALSSTSRYWQALSEPHLYKHVCFTIEDADKAKTLLLTLLKRPGLAQYIRTIYVDPPSKGSEVTSERDEESDDDQGNQEDSDETNTDRTEESDVNGSEGAIERPEPVDRAHPESSLDEGVPSLVPIEDIERLRREQRFRDELQAFIPQMMQIIEATWPKLSQLIKTNWIKRMNDPETSYEPFLALILTLAINLEELDHQYSERGVKLTSIILHYHRTSEEIVSANAYPLSRLTDLCLRGVTYPEDLGRWIVYWVPLPVNATRLTVQDHFVDHFEYPAERDLYHIPKLEMVQGEDASTIKQLHPGFTPMLRVLDLSRCKLKVGQLSELLASGYCSNIDDLRLTKMGPSHHWYSEVNWPIFGHLLKAHLPRLCALEITVWWDEPDEDDWFYDDEPEDVVQSIGALEKHPVLECLSIDIGLLVHSFEEDALTEVPKLPSTTIPQDLTHLALLNVNPVFLESVAQEFAATERRDVFGQLMTALSKCNSFAITTYAKPRETTLKSLDAIAASMATMGVDFRVFWVKGGDEDDDECIVHT